MKNVVRRSYLAKVNPITINFEKVKMEIKRKIDLIKSYRAKKGNTQVRLKDSNYETLVRNKNGVGNSKPYYSFFEEQEKLNKNKYREDLKEKSYDEELLSQKESEYFEDESEDDYEERVKNYYKNKKVSSLSKYKNDKDDSDGDVEIYGNKFRRKISDKILNKYNRKKELYNDDLDEYSEQNDDDDDLENEDRIVRKNSNNKMVKNQRIRYLEEDEDFLYNRGDEIDRYKYSPAIINIKNIYPVRGGCGEKNKYGEENIVRKSRVKLNKFEEDTEFDEADIPRKNRSFNRYQNEDRGIEKFESRNFEKKRNGEDFNRGRISRDRNGYSENRLSKEEDDEFFENRRRFKEENLETKKRRDKDCEGDTIISINVSSKKRICVDLDKQESRKRRQYESEQE